jgi:hypothetical protein
VTTPLPVAPRPPSHEAIWPRDLFTDGIGWVIIARFKSGGERVEAGIFLVDVFCLGVKLAVYEDTVTPDYRRRIHDHYMTEFPMVDTSPACARKLVENAVEYARGLGFAPPADYRKAARVFGGLAGGQCPEEFTFGHDGKPLYRRGPRETETQARGIIEHLHQRCGAGNYDYIVALGDAEEITRRLNDSDRR